MTDILTRLRTWVHAVDAVSASDLMEEAAAEIERLRGYRDMAESDRDVAMLAAERLRKAPCPYVVGTTTQYCSLTPFTLTDEEREAIDMAILNCHQAGGVDGLRVAATLRSLLERTNLDAAPTAGASDSPCAGHAGIGGTQDAQDQGRQGEDHDQTE
jgi:hypothetical protein